MSDLHVEELVKRNVFIAITGLIYVIPTVLILVSELGKPDCSYFSIVMTIGLVSIPQGWRTVRELAGVKISFAVNKLEDIGIFLILLVFKIIMILALSALFSPFIFILNLAEFIRNCAVIRRLNGGSGGGNGNDR